MFNPLDIRKQFPIFTHYPDLVYLDSAATTQKPYIVLAVEQEYYERHNANVHRGIYRLAAEATALYEGQFMAVNRSSHS